MPNPINPKKVAKIPLKKFEVTNVFTNLVGDKEIKTSGNIEGIVFWSKNPKPMLNQINQLNDYLFYFLYTLNPYPNWIEGCLPPLEDRINSFKELSKHCPVIWRYDPILIADGIDVNCNKIKTKYNTVGKFSTMLNVQNLEGKELTFALFGEGGKTLSKTFELLPQEVL